jgi:NAD(P)H-dependent flavin oxidoreductase YrpB (nitropropane dioxygenase family)
MDTGSIMAGQSAGLVKQIKPVKDILSAIYDESRYAKGELK